MSGGSFNYLCDMDVDSPGWFRQHDLTAMAQALGEMGTDGLAAAAATLSLRDRINRDHAETEDETGALRGLWHAVEWWYSCDWREEQAREVLATYNAALAARQPPKYADVEHELRAVYRRAEQAESILADLRRSLNLADHIHGTDASDAADIVRYSGG